jgi:HEPN domain-containing protein
VDILRQMAYWREAAEEDWVVACELVSKGRTRHGLFFAHLAFEKLLKAHVCRRTQQTPPRIHNLVRLAEKATLTLTPEHLDVLADMNAFHIEGRYPLDLLSAPAPEMAREYLRRAEEVRQWLLRQF